MADQERGDSWEQMSVRALPSGGNPLAYLIRPSGDPTNTTFPVPSDLPLQVGFVVYPAGSEIARHVHLPVERNLRGMSEVLVVRRGVCEMDLYDDGRNLVVTEELQQGDIVLITGGGHAFRMTEDTVLLEIKQGPYLGPAEKEHF
jgi:hypothetical protein